MRSVWAAWPAIQRTLASTPHWILFLDFDGTLVPLAEHPRQVQLPSTTKALLRRLVHRPGVWIGIISGRALADLKRQIGIKGLYYVGNHGLELEGPKRRYVHPVAERSRPLLRRLGRLLASALQPIRGAWVENKRLTLSIHYRSVAPRDLPMVKRCLSVIVEPYRRRRQVRVTLGKRVVEVRPPTRWTKGSVVQWLWAKESRRGGRMVPFYIGDDLTDEDAFHALRGRGVTVVVGPSTSRTEAHYGVKSPRDVQRLLRRLSVVRPSS